MTIAESSIAPDLLSAAKIAPATACERTSLMSATATASSANTVFRPTLTFGQILNMNVGFFGIQYSFGLQQSSMSPIYRYLGANEASLPMLWLAGPVTGLLVQPIIGAMSDRTLSPRGRRTPYFLVGAILC